METEERNKKTDIISIWKDLPFFGDIRDPEILNIFAHYTMYEQQIRLMAQMRIILMSETKYGDLKSYLDSIKDNDEKIFELVENSTEDYINNFKPKFKKDKLENYTQSIRNFMKKDLSNDKVETKVYNIKSQGEEK